jgi:hypothetical protein
MSAAIRLLVVLVCATSTIARAGDIERRVQVAVQAAERQICEQLSKGEIFVRTELLLGLSRSDGSAITAEEFQSFVDLQVTPRFPEGLTVLNGNGQFRNSAGHVVQEGSKLLILLYPLSREHSARVDEIRSAYKTAFHQESVLRVDEYSCVSF